MPVTGNAFYNVQTMSVNIDSDLSSKSGYAVNLDASDRLTVNLATDSSAPVFVLWDDGDGSVTALEGSIVLPGAVVEVKAGGSIDEGAKVTATTGGKFIATTTDTQNYAGIAMEAAASNDMFLMLVAPGMIAG